MQRILIIKLGALGDFFMAQPAFAALRAHHRADHLTLLTIAPLAEPARRCGCFDEVLEDSRERSPRHYLSMRRRIRAGQYGFVYDLQGNSRTAWYWRLLWPERPRWAGPVPGCSHPRPPRPDGAHRTEWYRAQLAALGITEHFDADSSWMEADVGRFGLRSPYILLAAGAAPHRPQKRWPAAAFVALAREFVASGVTPVLIGAAAEKQVNARIASEVQGVVDLTGQTSILDLGGLARRAAGAVGNDTGPMHAIAFTGCPTLTLFSAESDPGFIAPRGPRTACLQRASLADLEVAEVMQAARQLFRT